MYVHEFKSLQQIAVLTEAHCSDIEVPNEIQLQPEFKVDIT